MIYKGGRGAQINTHNRFEKNEYQVNDDYLEFLRINGDDVSQNRKTRYLEVTPKSIVNKVNSPDVGSSWSLNPYQGCEHGCTYCYARNSHEYWGYSAGSEFEQNILIKKNAPLLLEELFQKKSWVPETIMLSGNTDCYQPAENKFRISRSILELMLKYRHPVGIITKNALIQRDIDILRELAKMNLVQVSLSITTLKEEIRRKMEPRTATVKKRLQTIEALAKENIPVRIMMAPIIPGLTSEEIMPLAKAVSEAGAVALNYTVVRLNGQIAEIFMDWVEKNFPDRADKIKHQIQQCHGGKLNDSDFGRRMRGDGVFADYVKQNIELARIKYFKGKALRALSTDKFLRLSKGQYNLFGGI